MAQQNLLLAKMRKLGLHPQDDLAVVLGRLAGGRTLADLDGAALDAVLRELPELAREILSRAHGVSVADLFERVRANQSPDGDWTNAAASFAYRAARLITAPAALREFVAAAVRSADLPQEFRNELARQSGRPSQEAAA